MERSINNHENRNNSFAENFDCSKMRNLITSHSNESFGDKFKNWIENYTKNTREKIWMDIESYRAW